MRNAILITLAALLLPACWPGTNVVRDKKVYKTEVKFMSKASLDQAKLLKQWVAENCKCDSHGHFTTDLCNKSAKTALVIEARVPWHADMMNYNGSVTDKRPPKDPPEVPGIKTLCKP